MVETYLTQRRELAAVVVITDARRPPTDMDKELIAYLGMHDIPFIVVPTKADKLGRAELAIQRRVIHETVGTGGPVVFFSSLNGVGKNDLWKELKSFIDCGRGQKGLLEPHQLA